MKTMTYYLLDTSRNPFELHAVGSLEECLDYAEQIGATHTVGQSEDIGTLLDDWLILGTNEIQKYIKEGLVSEDDILTF